jgi:hypothetical protein
MSTLQKAKSWPLCLLITAFLNSLSLLYKNPGEIHTSILPIYFFFPSISPVLCRCLSLFLSLQITEPKLLLCCFSYSKVRLYMPEELSSRGKRFTLCTALETSLLLHWSTSTQISLFLLTHMRSSRMFMQPFPILPLIMYYL